MPHRLVTALCALGALLASPSPSTPTVSPDYVAASTTSPTTASGYRITTARLSTGARVPLRWNPCRTISYQVNPNGLPASARTSAVNDVRRAAQDASRTSGLRLVYRGQTRQIPGKVDGSAQSADILIAFVTPGQSPFNLAGGILAVGGPTHLSWTSRRYNALVIERGMVAVDARDYVTRARPGDGRGSTRGNLLRHELGHALGLDHYGNASQIMSPYLTEHSAAGFTHAGDRRGLRAIGRSAGCLPVVDGLPDLR